VRAAKEKQKQEAREKRGWGSGAEWEAASEADTAHPAVTRGCQLGTAPRRGAGVLQHSTRSWCCVACRLSALRHARQLCGCLGCARQLGAEVRGGPRVELLSPHVLHCAGVPCLLSRCSRGARQGPASPFQGEDGESSGGRAALAGVLTQGRGPAGRGAGPRRQQVAGAGEEAGGRRRGHATNRASR